MKQINTLNYMKSYVSYRIIIYIFIILAYSLSSCTAPKTLLDQYPGMYKESPVTIAIMPPINKTTHVEAKDFFYTTMYIPLCEKGYYVYSPYLTMEMFQQESAYDAEIFLNSNLAPFRNVFNADAVMFTVIKKWERMNLLGMIDVNIEYILRSTKTGETLYNREGQIILDTSVNAGGGIFGLLASVVATTINTAITDKVVAGRKCNIFVLSDLPAGKYSPFFGKDKDNPAGSKIIKATVR